MSEDWLSFAERDPSPPEKQGYSSSPSPPGGEKTATIFHSMDGSYAGSRVGLMDVSVRKSWTGSVLKDGRVIQHLPLTAHAWHCGSASMNIASTGWEFEGGGPGRVSEPLTDKQVERAAQILVFQKERFAWPELARSGRHKSLYEHGEVVATACPSHRIPWARIMLLAEKEDEDMELQELDKRQKAASVLLLVAAKALAGSPLTQAEHDISIGVIQGMPIKD